MALPVSSGQQDRTVDQLFYQKRKMYSGYVKTRAPALTPLLRSDLQGDLLALLLLNPEREYSLTDLATATRVGVTRVHTEVNRISVMGVVSERRVGASRLVRANTDNPIVRPLTDLLELTYGPQVVLPRALSNVSGIDMAYIYGSWAARRAGEPGPPPADVDVLVVGEASRKSLHAAADQAEKVLRRPVNIQRVPAQAWHDADSTFVRQLKSRPLIELDLGENP